MILVSDVPPKHPDSRKWYWLKWSDAELQGATITNSVWSAPAGITVDETAHIDRLVGVRLSGGTLKQFYELENETALDNGEILHEILIVEISKRGH